MPYFGLSSFLPAWSYERNQTTCKFQCPTSGFLLFYLIVTYRIIFTEIKFQCPTSGFLLFYVSQTLPVLPVSKVSMPYLGLSSFLRYVSASLEFTGFANPFLRVIIWQFDFKPFFSCYFPYSYFSHILFYFVRFPWHIYLNMIPAILQ